MSLKNGLLMRIVDKEDALRIAFRYLKLVRLFLIFERTLLPL